MITLILTGKGGELVFSLSIGITPEKRIDLSGDNCSEERRQDEEGVLYRKKTST
jgi:hypothetical protein